CMSCSERHNPIALAVEERFAGHDQPASTQVCQGCEGFIQLMLRAGIDHADRNNPRHSPRSPPPSSRFWRLDWMDLPDRQLRLLREPILSEARRFLLRIAPSLNSCR